ncbi:T9SS type A sorting domain-containing protein [candidate division KSB1 bacterium]|nr:T9SS type A sorting domain-containing protein [candidate division KSB1 bacterium]
MKVFRRVIFRMSFLIAFFCYSSPNASTVVFEVNPTQQFNEIKPIWDILNLWSPSLLVNVDGTPNTWHRDTHPFVNRVILMTATGGRPDYPQVEILKKDSLGNLVYDFKNFDVYIAAALHNQFKPIIVLGAIPFVLAPENYHIGAFGSITDPPIDYVAWYDFVKTLITHSVEKFGLNEVKSWQWRLYTEPDNRDWWSGTKEEYFKLYDYTAAAALEVVPGIILGPGNMLGEIEDNWGLDFIDHAMTVENYYTGATGSYFKFFTISAYERCVKSHPPLKQFETRMQTIKDRLLQYGALDTIAIGFDEGQLITDENGVYLWLGDGTEYGASWQAAYHILGLREGFERIVHWGFTADGVKTPKYNVIEMLEKMKGDVRIQMQLTADNRSYFATFQQKIDGIASVAADGNTIRVLIYSHHKYRYPHPTITEDPVAVQIDVNALPFKSKFVQVTHWGVDSTHSNFFNTWLDDSRDLPRVAYNGMGGSIYDAGVNSNFNQDGHVFWWYHKPLYLEIDDLEKMAPDTCVPKSRNGSVSFAIGMRLHQVSLLELRPDTTTGIASGRASIETAPPEIEVFPNPFNQNIVIKLNCSPQVKSVRIYNLAGKTVKQFEVPGGTSQPVSLSWRGEDQSGRSVSSGIYFISALLEDRRIIRKVTLLR